MYLSVDMFSKFINVTEDEDVISYDDTLEWLDSEFQRGAKKVKINKSLFYHARTFFGNYGIQDGILSFKKRVYRKSDHSGEFWFDSFHDLGDTHEIVFSKFREVMEEPGHYRFYGDSEKTLVDFWVEEFDDYLKEIDYKYPVSSYNIKMAFYAVVGNTIDGLIKEVSAFNALKDFFARYSNIEVQWADDSMERDDIDIVIWGNGKVWHTVSVKCGGAFTENCIIEKYRKEKGKTRPTCYVDENLNRIFVRRGSVDVWHSVLSDDVRGYFPSI